MTIQCGRCGGSGRYDRGTCFDCSGKGFVNRKCKPAKYMSFRFLVQFANGTKNFPTIHAESKQMATALLEREIRANGWDAEVYPLDPLFT